MHCATAAEIKGRRPSAQDKPRDGSHLRRTFDLFQSNRGIPIAFTKNPKRPYEIAQLCDTWGLDIRRIQNGRWLLAGEWFGKVYIDYVAEQMERAQ